jgi:ACS family hexuronate transporter-like MFS transporter
MVSKKRELLLQVYSIQVQTLAVVAPIMVPWILGAYGWREAFIITGGVGFIWLIFWKLYYETPTKHPKLSQEELEFINSDADEQEVETTESVKWIKLFGIRQTWAFVFGKMFTDPIWWFFLYWLPSYFAERFN